MQNGLKALTMFLVAALASTVSMPAKASTIYRMFNAKCTDSNHEEIEYGPGEFGVGPKSCSDRIRVELQMSDAYVPGDSFFRMSNDPSNGVIELFSFSDGVHHVSHTFEQLDDTGTSARGWVEGAMPERAGSGFLSNNWAGTYFFSAGGNEWRFGVEGGGGGSCLIGSIEGPYSEGGVCNYTDVGAYYSTGTYSTWQRVPEPGTLALLGLGLVGLGLSRRRKA